MTVIGLFGKMGSGKGIASKVLQEKFRFSAIGITDPIKCILRTYLQIPQQRLWGDSEERTDDVRKALQDFGSCGRAQNPDIWINYLLKKLKNNYSEQRSKIVVDDLRFYNEAKALKEAFNAKLIYIETTTARTGTLNPNLKTHETEKALDEEMLKASMHYTVKNNGSLEEFKNTITKIAEEILNDRHT